MALSDLRIRSAAPREKPYKLTDGGGLYLFVQPGGSKLWRMKYRFMGKEKLLSIGRYPEIGLARARKEQLAARELLVDGRDPSAVKQLEREKQVELHSRTISALTDQFLAKQEKEGRAAATLKKNRWVLDMAIAQIGNEPVTALKAPAVLKVLKKVEARGTYETARRPDAAAEKIARGDYRPSEVRRASARNRQFFRATVHATRLATVGAALSAARRTAVFEMD